MTKTAAAPTEQPASTALTVQQRVSVALKADKRRADFIELAQQSVQIVAVTNPASYQELHSARMRLKTARIEVTKEGEDVRDDAVKFQKGVIALQKELVGLIEPEEKRLQAIQDEHDTRVEREKQAKIEAEQRRVGSLQAAVEDIRAEGNSFTVLAGSVVIAMQIETVKAIVIDETFAEFKGEAERAKTESIKRLAELHAAALEYEAEQRRIAAERAELAKLREAEEQRIREQAERDAAETRKRAEEDAARKAAIDHQERESRARIDAENRRAQEQRDEADRVARLAREAEERKLAEERAKIDAARREQEDRDRQARAEQEERERAERQRLDAEAAAKAEQQRKDREAEEARKREAQRAADELLSARDLLVTFRNRYSALTEFAKVHKAIDVYMTQFNSERKKAA